MAGEATRKRCGSHRRKCKRTAACVAERIKHVSNEVDSLMRIPGDRDFLYQ